MRQIVLRTDLLCGSRFLEYTQKPAREVLIDEAANINMPDCICVAANVLLLCVLGRDPKQLKPVLSAHIETDECGNLHNRFAEDRGVSTLAFLLGCGIPVYRLTMQLCIAEGFFD